MRQIRGLRAVAVAVTAACLAACSGEAPKAQQPVVAAPSSFAPSFGPTPNVAEPLVAGDPGTQAAVRVHKEQADKLRRLPGYVGSGVSRHNGRTVIAIFTSSPVPERDRIEELDGIPTFYTLGGPLQMQPYGG